jgi:hypothetical protein
MEMKIQSAPLTIIDQTDSRKLEVYITSNMPTIQIRNSNSGAYTPDWTREGLHLTAQVFLESRELKENYNSNYSVEWYKDDTIVATNTADLNVGENVLNGNTAFVSYTFKVIYQGIEALSRITFARVDTGEDGSDGTSVRILGTAKSATPVDDNANYYTIVYDTGAVVAAELGDAYVLKSVEHKLDGHLFVCALLNGGKDGTTDYFIDAGQIQGPAGDPAKSIVLTGSSQVLKIAKDGKISPSTVTVTAHTVNLTAEQAKNITWEYRYNASGTWNNIANGTSTSGGDISRKDNVVTINGNKLNQIVIDDEPVMSVVLRAAFEDAEDVLTIYKTFDGEKGDTASMAFLTNENISFSANANGEVITGVPPITINVVAYNGLKKVMPEIGTITDIPDGMTITVDKTSLASLSKEIILTLSVGEKKNFGSPSSNYGVITVPVISPVSTTLKLSWSKINAGPEGEPGVGIERIDVDYGSSKTSDVKVEDISWSDTIPVVPEGEYLWTRTTINYTDSKKQDTATYTYVQQGKKGDTGTFVDDADIQYAAGLNATTPPSSGWSTAVVETTTDKQYLWTKTIFKLSDGTAGDPVYSVAKQGVDGSNFRTFTTEYETNQTSMETWSKMESSEWNVNESTSGTKVGDTVMLRCYNTTKQGYSYILVTVISIPGDKVIHAKSMGLLDKGDPGTDAYTVLLTNESHVFVGGATSAIAGEASTQVLAYIGASAQPVTIITVNGVAASTNETNTNVAGLTFKCNMLSGNSPTITFKCTTAFVSPSGTIPIKIKVGNLEFTKMFTYAIAFKGSTGPASSSYWLVSNASAVQKTSSGDILCTPAILTFTGRIQTGTSAPANYAARWILAYSTDGSTYTDSYTSTANEATASIAASSTYKAVRARMYLAGGTTTLLDEQIIPFVSDGETGAPGATGDNAVTFQVYSNNGYALSTSIPTILLQTFAYFGDVEITSGATFQWYRHNGTDWVAVSGATNDYFNVSRDDVSFSNNYMCKMQFNGTEYVGVVTIDDKNDENKVFASKPSNYFAGDLWIVGTDYAPPGFSVGTMLRAEHTNASYTDSDWVAATKYDDEIDDLRSTIDSYKQYFSVNSTNGLQIGNSSINNDVLTIDHVETSTIDAISANIESLNVVGKYSGSTMLQAPIINLGKFSIVIESNGSLSIVANT